MSCTPAIDPVCWSHILETAPVAASIEALVRAEPKEATRRQRLVEQIKRALLEHLVEIDENVATRHQVHFGEYGIRGQTMVRERHPRSQSAVEDHVAVRGRVVVGQSPNTTGPLVVASERR